MSQSTAERLGQASNSLEKGDYRNAEIRLKALLQKQGDNAQAWLMLGRVSLATYRYPDAVEQFRRATANGIDAAAVAVPMAKALLGEGEYKQALEALGDGAASDAEVLVLQGRAHLALDQVDAAKDAFDKSLELQPDYAPALVGEADIASRAQDMERARALLGRATSGAPQYAPAWQATARMAYAENNCSRAEPAFKKLLALKDAGPPVQLFESRSYLADCQLRTGKVADAKRNIGILVKQAPQSAYANYLQSLIDIRERNYDQASQHLQRVLSSAPNSVRSLTLLASIKLEQGDKNAAELYLKQAITIAPNDVSALRLLASLYLQRNEDDRAVRMLEDAYASNPGSDGIRALLAQAMASRKDEPGETKTRRRIGGAPLVSSDAALRIDVAAAMARTGNTSAALALLDGFTPENADESLSAATIRIGIDLRDQRPEQAVETARKLVSEAADDVARLRLLARTYTAIGNADAAGKTLDRALEVEPKNTDLLLSRAGIFARLGQYADATRTLTHVLELAPSDLKAQLALAQLAAAQGKQAESISWQEKAYAAHPENSELALRLVQSYLAAQRTADGLELASRLATDQPANAAFARIKGVALLADGQGDAGIASLSKAAALAPDEPAYRLDLAQAQIAQQHRDSALQQLERLRRERPDFLPAASVLARLQAQMGDADAALKTVQDIPIDKQNRVSVNTLKAQVLATLGKYDQAAAVYSTAYGAEPNQSLALALFDTRRRAGAEHPQGSLIDWLKRRPQDTVVALRLAQWYQSSDQVGKAEQAYRNLLSIDGSNAVALNNLALISSQRKEGDAEEYARRAHDAAPDNPAIADTLGWILVNGGGEVKKGVDLLRMAAADLSDDPNIQYHLAFGLAVSKDPANQAQARKILGEILKDDAPFDERASAQALLKRLQNSQPDT
ncbi:tetratricopeptide repeat protein [Salinisphaera aquimarina]